MYAKTSRWFWITYLCVKLYSNCHLISQHLCLEKEFCKQLKCAVYISWHTVFTVGKVSLLSPWVLWIKIYREFCFAQETIILEEEKNLNLSSQLGQKYVVSFLISSTSEHWAKLIWDTGNILPPVCTKYKIEAQMPFLLHQTIAYPILICNLLFLWKHICIRVRNHSSSHNCICAN